MGVYSFLQEMKIELEKYLQMNVMSIADGQRFDVLQYWLKRRYRQPQVAKLAFTHGQYHL